MAAKKRQSRSWLLFALAALLFFGLTNFFLGLISEKSGGNLVANVKAAMLLWLGAGCLGLGGAVYFMASGRGFSGLPRKSSLALPLAAGVALALGMFVLKISLAVNPLAKGPMVAIASSNSLIVALLAWMFLKEKLSLGQGASFLVIIAGIVLVSLGGMASGHFGAVAYAAATMVLFGTTNFLLKIAGEQGCDSITVAVILWLTMGGCGVLAFVWHGLAMARLPWLQPAGLGWLALLAGIFLGLGMFCVKKAVTAGPAGPATAIAGSNAILVSLLDFGILGHWLPGLKLVGMLVAISGIVALALARPRRNNHSQRRVVT